MIYAQAVFNHSYAQVEAPAMRTCACLPRKQEAIKGTPVKEGQVALFGAGGNEISAHTGASPAKFLLVSGIPLHEPIAWGGPIVMNTEEELAQALEELQLGTFIKKK